MVRDSNRRVVQYPWTEISQELELGCRSRRSSIAPVSETG